MPNQYFFTYFFLGGGAFELKMGIDCLICIWVRAPTFPMQLGITDGPFLPHNVISAQQVY